VQTHEFQYRRLLACELCKHSLIGERQKGHAYYRCHTSGCPTACVREEVVDATISATLTPLRFASEEKAALLRKLHEVKEDIAHQWEAETATIRLRQAKLRELMDRLTDAYLEHLVDKNSFESRKASILMEQKAIEEQLAQPKQTVAARMEKFLELAMTAPDLYERALADERRELLQILTSNRTVQGKNVVITLKPAFQEVANRNEFAECRPSQGRHRTLEVLISKLIGRLAANPSFIIDEFSTYRTD